MHQLAVPNHVAIIMDGNNRWAIRNQFPFYTAYNKGADAAEKIISHAAKLGIKYLTLYAFSQANWERPQEEVNLIMHVFKETMLKQLDKISRENIKIIFIGDRSKLSSDILQVMEKIENISQGNDLCTVRIAIGYSARHEILRAALLSQGKDQASFESFLNPHKIPDPDLLIRTSGEMRVSDFLLWEIAYTELYFTNILWPDFSEVDLDEACHEFKLRNRRFGKR